ncbi:iron-containing alcohol dehydrogenase [Cohnella lubricantis]|uniref:Iron-containing alcohol dehydrogenase n=1 Tax=Cohnella lubricantis TaxID=2163172 RepID=A0A841TLI3_9BACL|nr:iron-containing alcohol dehydrogenase [Cohnella lubricantis]MBB6679787.1 iron-containing alcohol dehydrogenase [Cohnella lubricantis]MBP2120239.1 alcohol dehydrogenase YqhD (iron-dependent ADH family) [Cohnella lubricantis]
MNNFTFHNPTKIIFGEGSLSQLGQEAAKHSNKALIVYGGGSVKRTGLYDKVVAQLKEHHIETFELGGIEPNPRLATVRKGIEIIRSNGIGFILAVGGGSVIDASKAIAAGVPYEGDVWDFLTRQAKPTSAVPLGTVLTLSATGSEMNGGAVITNWEENRKLSFGSIYTFPKFSILDPTLTFTVPADQTAYGSVDMMTHVFEQYFSHTTDTPLQERLCESIMRTIVDNAPIAIAKPDDYAARANLMLCGTYALNGGMISVGVQGDWASHGIEHELSAIYDIPHGAGLSIVYPNWMKHVYRERIERFVQFAVRVWDVDPSGKTDDEIAMAGIQATREFFTRIGAPATLTEVGIGDDRLKEMADKAVHFGPLGSFKKLTSEDVEQIYRLSL